MNVLGLLGKRSHTAGWLTSERSGWNTGNGDHVAVKTFVRESPLMMDFRSGFIRDSPKSGSLYEYRQIPCRNTLGRPNLRRCTDHKSNS